MTTRIRSTRISPVLTAPAVVAAVSIMVGGLLVIVADHVEPVHDGGSGEIGALFLIPACCLIVGGMLPAMGGFATDRATRRRWSAGIVLAVVSSGWLAGVYTAAERPPSAALPASTIRTIRGTARADLRPSSSTSRYIPLSLTEIRTQAGWTGSAEGHVRLLWEGPEHLVTDSGISTVVPHRGDVIEVDAPFPHAGRSAIWANSDSIRVVPTTGAMSDARRGVREGLRRRLARLPHEARAMALALLLGTRGEMAPEMIAAVRGAGASHVIALSGMHLGVLALLLGRITSRIVTPRVRRIAVLGALFGYVWVAGWIPSLLRALILACLILVAADRDRSVPPAILLGRCVVLTAVIAPQMVWALGFQLSLWALIGLFFFSPRAVELLSEVMPAPVAGYIGVTVGPLVATAPVSLVVFGTIYPVGVFSAGILAVYAVVLMWGAILFVVVAPIPVVGSLLAKGLTVLTGSFSRVSAGFAAVPGIDLSQSIGLISLIGWGTTATAITVWAGVQRRRRRNQFCQFLESHGKPQLNF